MLVRGYVANDLEKTSQTLITVCDDVTHLHTIRLKHR